MKEPEYGPNLAATMFRRARDWPERPMLRWHAEAAWHAMNWGSFGRQVAAVARGLRAAGVLAGDRVMLVMENRPEFPIAEVALMAIRAVPVPAYTTNTVADHAHILSDSGARAAIVSRAAFAERVFSAGPLDLLVTVEASPHATHAWGSLVLDPERDCADIAAEAEAIAPGALACLIYTSGTGGAPRGVMLAHRAILSNCVGAVSLVRGLDMESEVYLSFLPLAHVFEHTVGQFFLLSMGSEIVYARGIEHLSADMLAVRPTILTAVPRILDVIRARILLTLSREPAWRQALFHRAIAVGAARAEGSSVGWLDRALDPVLERLVRRKVRARFGGRFHAAMSGGARLDPETGRFFLGLGITLMQGYGQTEAGPVIAANAVDAIRIETVGRALNNVAVRIAEDGEILVQGDLVMDGYWGRPEETRAVIRGGWLHTGDIGRLDGDGYLTLTDRKKDMIVLSGGENVSPARVEGFLVGERAIAQAAVFGEGRAGLAALLVAAEGFEAAAVGAAVAAVNKRLSVTERIRRHAVVEPFTLENGLLTPSQKVRRHLVAKTHAEILAGILG